MQAAGAAAATPALSLEEQIVQMQAAGSSLEQEVARLRAENLAMHHSHQQAVAAAAAAAQAAASAAAASQAGVQARGPSTSSGRPKGPTPPEFDGSRVSLQGREVDAFLRDMSNLFAYHATDFPDDASKVRYASLFLKSAAATWWDTLDKSDGVDSDWSKFTEHMHKRYRPMVAKEVARQQLHSLRQTGTVSAWCDLFRRVLTAIDDMNDADQVFLFVQGLKRVEVANEVRKAQVKTLHDAMVEAVRADAFHGNGRQNAYYSRGGSSSASAAVAMDLNAIQLESSTENAEGDHGDDTPNGGGASRGMEPPDWHSTVDRLVQQAVEHRLAALSFKPSGGFKKNGGSSSGAGRVPGLSSADVAKLRAEGKCFRCKKTGHLKRECPLLSGKPNFQ